jgi:chemotaxis signal transduction protein
MEPLAPLITTTSLTQLTSQPFLEVSGQKFLRFALGSQDRGLLPLEAIAEVLNVIVADILPVPEMPSCVLGIYNWRGKMLWLVDLNHLVDYPPLIQLGTALEPVIAMVIQMNGQSIGLVVQSVKDIELHDATQLQKAPVGLFPPRLLSFVKGYLLNANGLVFDTEAIARCPMWQVHRG